MHDGSVALADRQRQFHPNMDVTEKQRCTSLAGGMSPVLIMTDADGWCQGSNVLN